ncbi:MAG: nitroreductase family protein [Candidatus Hermodarchaeota archaeon]|nr:nitroreductase family protein [Candidatus Hermodarchaeota archaeon]
MTKVVETQSKTPDSPKKGLLDVTEPFFKVIQKRRSIRRYKPYDIPDADLEKILNAARLAPSTNNSQSWRFIVIKDPEVKALLGQPSPQRFIANANAIIVVLGMQQTSCCPGNQARWHVQDPMIAAEHLVLAATALGYGSCWIATYESRPPEFIQEVKTKLEIPENADIVVLVALGVPDEAPAPRSRKPLGEIAFREKFGQSWYVL